MDKLEVENQKLKYRGDKGTVSNLEAEIAQLKLELKSAGKDIGSMKLDAGENRAIRSDLTPNEQIAL